MRTHILSLAFGVLLASPLAAQQSGYVAAPSTRATAELSLTLADTAAQRAAGKAAIVRIDYGQPHLRGRTLLTGDLVPMGTVWRLGANAATILTTDVALTLGDKSVPAGRYIMQALPETSGWTLILQRETTGAAAVMLSAYDASKDFARIPLTATSLTTPLESLSITIIPGTGANASRGELRMGWGTVQLSAPFATR